MAATSVAPDRATAVAELAAPPVHDLAVGAHDVVADRGDAQRLLHVFEHRLELGTIHAPCVEHEVRGPKTGTWVDQRRPAHAAPDRQRDGRHADRERQAVAAIEPPKALRRRAREIAPVEMLALFEDDDLQARLRELLGGNRAAGAAADDNHVRVVVEALVRLHDLELDYARVALDLFVGLPVVSDERLDAVVRAEEHENQRLERDERFAALADLGFLAIHYVGIARTRSQPPERPSLPAGD